MKHIALLGATGSIGTQALEVVDAHKDRMRICALTAYRNISLLEAQARKHQPSLVAIAEKSLYPKLRDALADTGIRVTAGEDGILEAASCGQADTVLNALVGIAGLCPTLTALEAGKNVALANKESLVTGGAIVTDAAKRKGVRLLPVDSEHSAIFQCLQGNAHNAPRKIILTASGGPFYGMTRNELTHVTREQALAHPNWTMGAKITIDSATLMNKGFELIEAVWLFDVRPEDVEIVVHRQSIIHSLVEFADHSVMAQLGMSDMRLPIQYALTYPDRLSGPIKPLSLLECAPLTFGSADEETFSCLRTAKDAITLGGTAPALINGANEEAVALFLDGKIPFLRISELVRRALELPVVKNPALRDVLAADHAARELVRSLTSSNPA